MIDVNTPLLKAYYSRLSGAITVPTVTGFVRVWEGEEPSNPQDQCYIVLSDVISNDTSTQSSSNTSSSIQISIYTWENNNNTALTANLCAGQVYSLVKALPNDVLALDGMQMLNLRMTNDRLERVGELAGRKYINRIIVFTQDIFIFT